MLHRYWDRNTGVTPLTAGKVSFCSKLQRFSVASRDSIVSSPELRLDTVKKAWRNKAAHFTAAIVV